MTLSRYRRCERARATRRRRWRARLRASGACAAPFYEKSGPSCSREDEIDFAPVLLRRGALAGPVRRVIELVGHLRRPVAADVTIEQIAFDRLAQARRAAGAIRLPSG